MRGISTLFEYLWIFLSFFEPKVTYILSIRNPVIVFEPHWASLSLSEPLWASLWKLFYLFPLIWFWAWIALKYHQSWSICLLQTEFVDSVCFCVGLTDPPTSSSAYLLTMSKVGRSTQALVIILRAVVHNVQETFILFKKLLLKKHIPI